MCAAETKMRFLSLKIPKWCNAVWKMYGLCLVSEVSDATPPAHMSTQVFILSLTNLHFGVCSHNTSRRRMNIGLIVVSPVFTQLQHKVN